MNREIVTHEYERIRIPLKDIAEICEMPLSDLRDRLFNASHNWADGVLILELRAKNPKPGSHSIPPCYGA